MICFGIRSWISLLIASFNSSISPAVSSRRPARTGYFARREREPEERVSRTAKVLPMTGASPVVTSSKMVITEPQCFDDVKEISEHLKERRSVIVNLETVTKEDQRRIIDFLSGATYVIDGSMQKISSLIYLITPKNVEIQNDIEKKEDVENAESIDNIKNADVEQGENVNDVRLAVKKKYFKKIKWTI